MSVYMCKVVKVSRREVKGEQRHTRTCNHEDHRVVGHVQKPLVHSISIMKIQN